ncbi:MAG: tetratricopeptide repeat protein [Candidatus Lokiarchaeota archaeon]|nr:tetratricopeptide repeat protein [Candidatus Lokiarchaeota archaeon]
MSNVKKNWKEKTEKLLKRAEQLFEALIYKKAGKYFFFVGNSFYDNKDFVMAQEAFSKAANSFIKKEKHLNVIESLRRSANAFLNLENVEQAQNLFEKAFEYTKNFKNKDNKDTNYILLSSLIYICSHVRGEPVKGLNMVKRAQKRVDKEHFKENPLIHLVTNLTIALRDEKKVYLDKIIQDFNKLKLTDIEKKFVKISLLLAEIQVNVKPEINIDKEKYTTKEIIKMNLTINKNSINEIINNSFFEYSLNEFDIQNFRIEVTDNFSVQTKPELPINLNLKENFTHDFFIKPHFLIDKCFIGPIRINCLLNKKYSCFIETKEEVHINLVAPPTYLEISLKNLKPPLIEQTFPIEILIENNSDGEASDLNIGFKFPEEIKVIRGTIEKQIYSLRSNENIKWEINARPLEAGDFEIEVNLKFKDTDHNTIEEKKTFPIAIKL